MRTFEFGVHDVVNFNGREQFIALGAENAEKENEQQFLQKLNYEMRDKVDGIWGTLGWENNSPFVLNGKIDLSIGGNVDEGGNFILTKREIEDLKAINPQLENDGVIRERFINFDHVDFPLQEPFNPVNLPRLRLTLFLHPDEGALVYYQHHKKGNPLDEESFIEYIMYQHEATDDRDRLDYFFAVEPKYKLNLVNEGEHLYTQSTEETGLSFTIKILTFKQTPGSEDQLQQEAVQAINQKQVSITDDGEVLYELVGKKKYNLLVFSPEDTTVTDDDETINYGGRFSPVTEAAQVDTAKKTLFLIHGTFVNTMKSYKDLILKKGADPSYLQYLLSHKYEQIIAFDHPTISHDAAQNAEWLLGKMNELGISFEGNQLDVITTSRGALIAEYMAADPECAKKLPMKQVLMFSAANGCGYFTTGKLISKGLSVWRKSTSGPAGKIVLSLLKLSVDYIMKQPGAVLMTINHDKKVLETILGKTPVNTNLQYKCVVSDWDTCLVPKDKWLARVGMTSLDFVIKACLGWKHDWVIGCSRQEMVPQKSVPKLQPHEYRRAVHGRYLELNYAANQNDCEKLPDPHVCIENYFFPVVNNA